MVRRGAGRVGARHAVLGALAACALAAGARGVITPAGAQEAGGARGAGPTPATILPTVIGASPTDGARYRLHAFRVPLARARLEVVDVGMTRGLDAALRARGATLVVNGGFFGLRGEPEGLVVSGGRMLSPFLARIGGGVLAARGGLARLFAAEAPPAPGDVDFAVQCRPRLVVDGAVNIRSDDGRRADRTALCLRDGGGVLEVVVARGADDEGRDGPTLHALARLLAARGCAQALNLDGGPSTGAAWREAGGVRVLPPRGPVRHAVAITLEAPGSADTAH